MDLQIGPVHSDARGIVSLHYCRLLDSATLAPLLSPMPVFLFLFYPFSFVPFPLSLIFVFSLSSWTR